MHLPCTRIARKMDRKLIRYQTDGFPDPLFAIYFTNVCSVFEEKIVRHDRRMNEFDFKSRILFCSFLRFASWNCSRDSFFLPLLIGNQARLTILSFVFTLPISFNARSKTRWALKFVFHSSKIKYTMHGNDIVEEIGIRNKIFSNICFI